MTKKGFIKLPRSILDWEQYHNATVMLLLIHLLITASFKDDGKVKRGQLVTSLRKLARETGLTLQKIRTALSVLESEHLITQESAHSSTTITICNYGRYQGCCTASQYSPQHNGQHTQQEKVSPTPPLSKLWDKGGYLNLFFIPTLQLQH